MADNPLLEPKVKTVPQALSRMADIQDYLVANQKHGEDDGVACFNFLYHRITERVLEAMNEGFFQLPEFIPELDTCFANLYFDAMRTGVTDLAKTPRSWRVLVKRRDNRDIAQILFAAAGINAHVNRDLALALVSCCENLEVELGAEGQREDFWKINEIFAHEMEELRQHFLDKTRHLDKQLLAPILNALGAFSVAAARDAAWNYAHIVWEIRRIGFARQALVEQIDGVVGLAGHLILTPVPGLADAL